MTHGHIHFDFKYFNFACPKCHLERSEREERFREFEAITKPLPKGKKQ